MQFYPFGLGEKDLPGSTELLGGKGAGLGWLAKEGVPVPPGFVIPTSVWIEYDKKPKTVMKEIAKTLPQYLAMLEEHFGYMPLLSVRSGARVSCPGMMDTILNVGLDGQSIPGWIEKLGPKCFGDSFHRLVTMYGSVVDGIRKDILSGTLKSALDAYQVNTGHDFPNAQAQLLGAIEAVFKSWDNDRANEYRKMHGYDRAWGTAVTVQAMVFGNLNDESGSGVLFTRNPDTGETKVAGEWLINAQGEDVVDGSRTPLALDEMKTWNQAVHSELVDMVLKLETLRTDMQDIEFTVQNGKLYLLQVRTGKRSATAAIKIALDMVKEGLIDRKTAVRRVSVKQLDLAQMVQLDPKFTKSPAFQGLPACSGIVTGKPVFNRADAINCKEPCILVTHETEPDDVMGMKAAVGIVTMVGGMTCHAAVVARAMDCSCIVGVGASLEAFKDVETLSIDGSTGRIWTEKVPVVTPEPNGLIHEFHTLVCESLQVVPVVFTTPVHKMPEAVLYLGDQILDVVKATQMVVATLNKVGKLYLDLTPSDAELKYLGIFAEHDNVGRVLNLLEVALEQPQTEGMGDRLVVMIPATYKTKFARLAPGADLRSIVLAESEIVMDGIDVNDPAVKKVLDWKKAEGALKVVSVGKYLAGSKSMVSVAQALQILGEVS